MGWYVHGTCYTRKFGLWFTRESQGLHCRDLFKLIHSHTLLAHSPLVVGDVALSHPQPVHLLVATGLGQPHRVFRHSNRRYVLNSIMFVTTCVHGKDLIHHHSWQCLQVHPPQPLHVCSSVLSCIHIQTRFSLIRSHHCRIKHHATPWPSLLLMSAHINGPLHTQTHRHTLAHNSLAHIN